ncbi:MAG: hypothetical protein Q9164_007378, partial [Protoblastenia rupestris]
ATLRRHTQIQPLLPLCQYHRSLFDRFFKRRQKDTQPFDPDSPAYKKKLEADRQKRESKEEAQVGTGGLAPSSIFEAKHPKREAKTEGKREPIEDVPVRVQDWRKMGRTRRDPNPRARIKWLKMMIIKDVRGRHRLNKTEKLLRTERVHLAKSPLIKTSVKKLGPLARQIAGKPLNEAMVQMRFSKKRAAGDVLKHLKYARSQAIVEKKMGLGEEKKKEEEEEKENQGEERVGEKIVVVDKSGKKRIITDKSDMYVDEAWVGRGAYEFGTDFRARGRAFRLHLPYTSKLSIHHG